MSHISKCDAAICRNGQAEAAPADEDLKRGQDIDCGICREVIYEKENEMDKYFGILTHCDHTFCYDCIARWRQQIITCPVCRTPSALAIKNKVWWDADKSPAEKLAVVQKHFQCFGPPASIPGRQSTTPSGSAPVVGGTTSNIVSLGSAPVVGGTTSNIVISAPVPAPARNPNVGSTSSFINFIHSAHDPAPVRNQTIGRTHINSSYVPFPARNPNIGRSSNHIQSAPFPGRNATIGNNYGPSNRRGERMNNQPTSAAARSSMPSTLLPPEIAARFPPDTQRRLEAALRRGQRLEDIINPAVLGLARGIRQ